ncbi:cofilin [Naegleria gruberi]|uniref:Cofilin n=1 Tax=Naegleria gruberi TaxID=5762 RepID=D2V144_NAEGR|nr:cofilin [Naegleria gruberi]EFC49627.1 cofilin [Naegleria gruberi]|eukprot:XP_002682371.1 cofilin [Naegleria gruberi]
MMLNTQVSDEIIQSYEEMRLGKGKFKESKFIVLHMEEGSIQIDQNLTRLQNLDELVDKLPAKNSRFICYHLSFEMPSQTSGLREGKRTKMVFITWCPNEVNVKEKFKVAATCKTVKAKLNGMSMSYYAGCKGELDEKQLIEKCITFIK